MNDIWLVLFECPRVRYMPAMSDVRDSSKAFLPQLFNAIEIAVDRNAERLSDARKASLTRPFLTPSRLCGVLVMATSGTASPASN